MKVEFKNNIHVRTYGPIQVITRKRLVQSMWGVSYTLKGSIRIDTGKTVRYIKWAPKYFHGKAFVTNVPR